MMRALSSHDRTPAPLQEGAEDLIRRHQGSVRGFLSFLGCPAHQVDDLCQDVFLVVLSRTFEDRSHASTAAFLRKVARNLYLKAMRRKRAETSATELFGLEQAWIGYQADDEGLGYLEALRQCLKVLRPRAAFVVDLRYRTRLAPASIAQEIGLSESGVKSILVRTKKRLRACVERKLSR